MKFKTIFLSIALSILSNILLATEDEHGISVYTGTFDTIDKEGDDKTTMFGVEHRNSDLFRNTILGKFSPLTGAFVTKKIQFIYIQE